MAAVRDDFYKGLRLYCDFKERCIPGQGVSTDPGGLSKEED